MPQEKKAKQLVRRLKHQVEQLRQKERESASQLQKAFKTIKKLGKSYEKKAADNFKKMKARIATAEAAVYTKAASGFDNQIQQKFLAKQKALGQLIIRYEEDFIKKFSGFLQQKALHLGKVSGKRAQAKKKLKKS